MSARSVMNRGRRMAESLMVDACTVQRQTGTTTDPDTGAVTPVYAQVYDGRCRIQSRNLGTESPTSGQQRVDIYAVELQVPITVTGVRVNDVVTVTVSADPDLVGREFRVNNLFHATHKTARRLPLEEITS